MGAWIETPNSADYLLNFVSHPSWVRGLKLVLRHYLQRFRLSHPSWVRGLKHLIEKKRQQYPQSHPSWVRGLKLDRINLYMQRTYVAPLVGAWIETIGSGDLNYDMSVAPLVGAWIETLLLSLMQQKASVAPLVGAWIETLLKESLQPAIESHPSWVRGLKPTS